VLSLPDRESSGPPRDLFGAKRQLSSSESGRPTTRLTDESDMAFCLGTLLCAMEYYGQALEYLECSIEEYGPNPQRLYNVALCCYRLREWDRARDAVGQALELAPEFSKARDLSIAIEGAQESTETPYGGSVLL